MSQFHGGLGIINRAENWDIPEGLFPWLSPAINAGALISKSQPPVFFLADVWVLFALHTSSFSGPIRKFQCTGRDKCVEPGSAVSRGPSPKARGC